MASENGQEDGRARILIISFSDMARDQRVFRQVKHLRERYSLTTVAFGSSNFPDVKFFQLQETQKTFLRKLLRATYIKTHNFKGYYYKTFDIEKLKISLSGTEFDLIIANDNESLPLAFEIIGKARLLHDAHEYSPRQQEDLFWWRFLMLKYKEWTCEQYLHRCDAITTVSQGIADEYARVYGVKATILNNAPDYLDIQPSPVQPGKIRMVHHGNASRSRKLELMLDLMDLLDDRFSLDMMLVPTDSHYFSEIKSKCAKNKKVRLLEPVPATSLIRITNSYDIGLWNPEAVNFNILHSLPNKFFEFIQARLAVAITPLPEMAAIVRHYDCGIVAEDFNPKTMAGQLLALTPEKLKYLKSRSDEAAKQLNSAVNMKMLDKIICGLLRETTSR